MATITRLSSNLTLFFKLFVPTFWIVFFGAFTIAVFVFGPEKFGDFPPNAFKIGTLFFFISGLLMYYFTLLKLMRVEADQEFVYVSNYFKHVRYPYHNIEKIETSDIGFFKTGSIYLKKTGSFGKRITFIVSRRQFEQFWKSHPELRKELLEKGE